LRINKFSMVWKPSLLVALAFLLGSCEEEVTPIVENAPGESALTRRERIRELEADLEVAKWENIRLTLKMRTVDGASLVRDKRTGLWHYDVERIPFTGIASENFENGKPRAEAHFLEGQKDGMERFWHPNGKLKEEGQWFNDKANGLMRSWDEEGKLLRAVRYKNGDLIEILRK
jgi:hypothetical protein